MSEQNVNAVVTQTNITDDLTGADIVPVTEVAEITAVESIIAGDIESNFAVLAMDGEFTNREAYAVTRPDNDDDTISIGKAAKNAIIDLDRWIVYRFTKDSADAVGIVIFDKFFVCVVNSIYGCIVCTYFTEFGIVIMQFDIVVFFVGGRIQTEIIVVIGFCPVTKKKITVTYPSRLIRSRIIPCRINIIICSVKTYFQPDMIHIL